MKLFIILLFFSNSLVHAKFFTMQSLKKYRAAQAYAQEDFSYALHCLEYCMDENPYDPECNYNIGNVLYQQRKYTDAQQSFLRVVKHEKIPAQLREQAYFNMGNSYYQMEEWQNAIDAYKEVIKINESNENARHNLQLAYYKLIEEQQREHQKKGEQQESDQRNQDNQAQENDQNNQQEDASSQNKESSNQPQPSQDQGQAEQQEFSDQEELGGENQDDKESSSLDKQSGQKKSDDIESSFDNQQINSSENQEGGGKGDNQDDNSDQDGDQSKDNNEEESFTQEEKSDSDNALGKKMQSVSRKKELKDDLKDQYESKASDDERLDDYYALVMKTLEEQEAKVQKYIIKNKVAMQSVGQHGKNGW